MNSLSKEELSKFLTVDSSEIKVIREVSDVEG